jgi:hypothetical protein
MLTPLIALFARWGLPEWVRKPLAWLTAALAVLALLAVLKGCYDRSLIREHEAEVKREVEAVSSAAAIDAIEASEATSAEVEAGNKAARDAAKNAADPLKAGLDQLRKD